MDPTVERLKSGFQKFKTEVYDKKPELFEPLKSGQSPRAYARGKQHRALCLPWAKAAS